MRHKARLVIPGIGDIIGPLAIETGHVQRVDRSLRRHLTVAGVAQPLPVRAVAGHAAVHVRELRPHECLVDPVE
ncbi:MAG: hypothetical protein QM757_40650 [Paludibaculum sp.]